MSIKNPLTPAGIEPATFVAQHLNHCATAAPYILDKTMYKVHVSLCSYYTIRILISKTLTGTYEGIYAYVFKMCCYRTLDIVIYIVANYRICI